MLLSPTCPFPSQKENWQKSVIFGNFVDFCPLDAPTKTKKQKQKQKKNNCGAPTVSPKEVIIEFLHLSFL